MLTEIGKFLRKIRIDRNMLLKDMAQGIDVSSAYLSTIETGKRPATPEIVKRLALFLGFIPGTKEYEKLQSTAHISRGEVSLTTKGLSTKHQETALAFSRQFSEMGENDLDKMLAVLNDAQKKRR